MEHRALLISLLISLAIVGVVLYVADLFQQKKLSYTYEELAALSKEELIAIILSNQAQEKSGLGRFIFPLAVVVVGVLSSLVTYLILRRYSAKKEDVLGLLRPDERKILEILAQQGGSVRQYELVAMSKLNKVKVHRVLKDLEQRDIVEIIPAGRYNIVQLKDPYRRIFT
ncbi:MAG: hypothetical protein GXO00_02745 [Candidatus Diapherotrites archaeon]|nr:hypothetical protein [Candidatus Diapherotrites archaeon]